MATIYSPSEKGFDERLTLIDKAQIALLREVMSAGQDLRFEVEVSGRPQELNRSYIRVVTVMPPASYAMAPFLVEAYTADMLAAMKVAAAMSDLRNAPRDVFDLYDLIRLGADPAPLLAKQSTSLLQDVRRTAMTKIEHIGFDLAREELLPYLPKTERDSLTEDRWMDYLLAVGEAIERWVDQALAMQASEADGPAT